MTQNKQIKALALFSGGLDSILAAKLVQEQGIEVVGLHFVSPFFGKPEKLAYWSRIYGLEIVPVDVAEEFAAMLLARPVHGFGSVLNPCVDCKILMLRRAKALMEEMGASFLISGEVLGQRPMSQRRDSLNVIRRDAEVKDILLRPLSALRLDPIAAELSGLVDREKLLGLSGRGRKEQMALAKRFGLKDIPTPAGGCLLTEQENGRRYWPVLTHVPRPVAADFYVANTGRQYWHESGGQNGNYWLSIGRKQSDNDELMRIAGEPDILFKAKDFPGPIALGRFIGEEWPQEAVESAAAFIASYSPKAVAFAQDNGPIAVRVHKGSLDAPGTEVQVLPCREPEFFWRECKWVDAQAMLKEERKP